ncbi:MAG: aminoacyl-tRNA hydrolase, partial [Desulfamplus sp.]|nr:aminoacyl-tRNA hydrolase [Desulfamplus sp.]
TKNFIRIRVGVGRPTQTKENSVTGHVLGKFAGDEQKEIDEVVKITADACALILSSDLKKAMNSFNSQKLPKNNSQTLS